MNDIIHCTVPLHKRSIDELRDQNCLNTFSNQLTIALKRFIPNAHGINAESKSRAALYLLPAVHQSNSQLIERAALQFAGCGSPARGTSSHDKSRLLRGRKSGSFIA